MMRMPFQLVVACSAISAALSFPAIEVSAAAAYKSSFQLLSEAILTANINAWGSFEQLPHTQVTVQITSDIYLYRWLPQLHPNATRLNVISNCSDAAGKPRRCVIYGRQKYGVFRTFKWIQWSSKMNCRLFVDNFVFTGIYDSVFRDVFCRITVKRSVFRNSITSVLGAVIRQYSFADGAEFVAFPPATFSSCLFRDLGGSAYFGVGKNRVWFYDSIFRNCTNHAVDMDRGYLALVRCKFGISFSPVGSILTASGATVTVHNTEVKGLIGLAGDFYPSYVVFCNSALSKVYLFANQDQKATLVFCNTTHDEVVDVNVGVWNIKKACPALCT